MKKGVMDIQEVYLFGVLFIIAIIIFGFFLLTAYQLKGKIQDTTSKEQFEVVEGQAYVQALLLTRLDAPIPRYLNGSKTVTRAGSYPGTVMEYAAQYLRECEEPSQFCTTFEERVMIFAQSVCHLDYTVQFSKGSQTKVIAPHRGEVTTRAYPGFEITTFENTPDRFEEVGIYVKGSQLVPSEDGAIQIDLICRSRHGVNV